MTYTAIPAHSPFHPDNDEGYRRWRDAKLAGYPTAAAGLIVEVRDPRKLTTAEHDALQQRLQKANMAIYVGTTGDDPDKAILRRLGAQFGLLRLDSNYLADDDGITSLTVNPEGEHPHYIPYTNRPIKWHTDGYYNTPQNQIRGLLLHCVHSAGAGGENGLIDPEIAYIRLRDAGADHIRALLHPEAMTIPPGKDGEGGERGRASGPVYSYDPASDSLHMRYTARKRNIEWLDDARVRESVALLERLLDEEPQFSFHARLEAGMGLLCNNVIHDRTGFTDPPGTAPRLIYRARYFDRAASIGMRDLYPALA